MLVWATIAALLVLALAALLGLVWLQEPVGASDADGDDLAADRHRPAVTPDYLRQVRVPGHGRGYDRTAVDALLQRAAEALESALSAPEPAASGEEVQDGGGDEAGGLDG
jgi:hypothetical protein